MNFERAPLTPLALVDLWSVMLDVPLRAALPVIEDTDLSQGTHTVVTEPEAIHMLRRYEQYPSEAVLNSHAIEVLCMTGPQAADYGAGSDLLRLCVGLAATRWFGRLIDRVVSNLPRDNRPDRRHRVEHYVAAGHCAATCVYSSRELLRQFASTSDGASESVSFVRSRVSNALDVGIEMWVTLYAASRRGLDMPQDTPSLTQLINACTPWGPTREVGSQENVASPGWRSTHYLHNIAQPQVLVPYVRGTTPDLYDWFDWLGMWSEATLGAIEPGQPYPLLLPSHSVYGRIAKLPKWDVPDRGYVSKNPFRGSGE